jgi:hypothetical protein
MTATDAKTETDLVRITYRDLHDLSFTSLSRLDEQLLELLALVNGYMNYQMGRSQSITLEDRRRLARQEAGWNTQIRRISYGSPLEYIVWFTTGGAGLLAIAARWAKVRAELARSTTVVRREQVKQAAYKVLLEHIKGQHFLDELARTAQGKLIPDFSADKTFQEAAEALADIEEIEKLD